MENAFYMENVFYIENAFHQHRLYTKNAFYMENVFYMENAFYQHRLYIENAFYLHRLHGECQCRKHSTCTDSLSGKIARWSPVSYTWSASIRSSSTCRQDR